MRLTDAASLLERLQQEVAVRLLLRSGRFAQGVFVSHDDDLITLRDDDGLARIPVGWVIDWQELESAPQLVAPVNLSPAGPAGSEVVPGTLSSSINKPADRADPAAATTRLVASVSAGNVSSLASSSQYPEIVPARALDIVGEMRGAIANARIEPMKPSFATNLAEQALTNQQAVRLAASKLKADIESSEQTLGFGRLQSLRVPIVQLRYRYPKVAVFASAQGYVALQLGNRDLAVQALARARALGGADDTVFNLGVAAGLHRRAITLDALDKFFDTNAPNLHPDAWYVFLGASLDLRHTKPLLNHCLRWAEASAVHELIFKSLILLLTDFGLSDVAHLAIANTVVSAGVAAVQLRELIRLCPELSSQEVDDEARRLWRLATADGAPEHRSPTSPMFEGPIRDPGRAHPNTRADLPELDSDAFRAARSAFTRGDVALAKTLFLEAYEAGDHSIKLLLLLCQTLQRLGEPHNALQLLKERLMVSSTPPERAALSLQQAQIESSMGLWAQAARSYEMVMRSETRPAALRNATLQAAAMQSRAGDRTRAAEVLQALVNKGVSDEVARRQLMALAPPVESVSDALDDLSVDVPDQPEGRISPLLSRDLELATFRDEHVLANGGRADQFDAARLLHSAISVRNAEFPERYPLFLEAAKAYSLLPEGSYVIGDFLTALSRYAMLKGGALSADLQRLLRVPAINVDELKLLRDGAMSYYLEALVFQATLRAEFMLVPLTNYLRVQVVCALYARGRAIAPDVFTWTFGRLFDLCLMPGTEDRDTGLTQELMRIAFDTLISCGAAGGRTWRALANLNRGELRRIVARTLDDTARRKNAYAVLSELCGIGFNIDQGASEVLRQAFTERARRVDETAAFCQAIARVAPSSQNFRELSNTWSRFPAFRGILLETDDESRARIGNLLATLAPYTTRSQDEMAGILISARATIEGLLQLIDSHPTRWGREAFEPLLRRWLLGIREIERRRASKILPVLRARLEPEIFSIDRGTVQGGLMIENMGLGTADEALIKVVIRQRDQEAWSSEAKLRREIAGRAPGQDVGGSLHFPIDFPSAQLAKNGDHGDFSVDVQLTPVFRGVSIDSILETFTLEVGEPATFTNSDIPWKEQGTPSEHLFKGREDLLGRLGAALRSSDRARTHIMYGLTRTGKTSLLDFLKRRIHLRATETSAGERFFCIKWEFETAASLSSREAVANFLLRQAIATALQAEEATRELADAPVFRAEVDFGDFEGLLLFLRSHGFYPVFLVDEFSTYRVAVDKGILDSAFLGVLRRMALTDHASFVAAGTYDLKSLMRDPIYGITGQFVNAVELQVNRIAREPALDLIRVMEPTLHFTDDAKEYILALSFRFPYFVQIICGRAAQYACSTRRRTLGFPEVERVVQMLCGGAPKDGSGLNLKIDATAFHGNMVMPNDPRLVAALFTTIAALQGDTTSPRPVSYRAIQDQFRSHGLRGFERSLALYIEELVAREVLVAESVDELPSYRIGADLFRRWWSAHHPHLDPELDALQKEFS